MTRAATNPKDAFFKAWQVYRSDESKKWRRSINSSSGHIVSMSLTELSLGPPFSTSESAFRCDGSSPAELASVSPSVASLPKGRQPRHKAANSQHTPCVMLPYRTEEIVTFLTSQ